MTTFRPFHLTPVLALPRLDRAQRVRAALQIAMASMGVAFLLTFAVAVVVDIYVVVEHGVRQCAAAITDCIYGGIVAALVVAAISMFAVLLPLREPLPWKALPLALLCSGTAALVLLIVANEPATGIGSLIAVAVYVGALLFILVVFTLPPL